MRPLATLCLLAPLLLAGGVARADEQGDLEKARAAYLARQYDDAEARLRAMLDPNKGTLHDPTLVTQARMYLAAAVLQKGKRDDANAILERLLLDDPQYEPDPLSFPTETIDLFIDVRTRIRDKLNEAAEERARFEAAAKAREAEKKRAEAARVATLEKMATEETVTTLHSRWVALVPFGTGQFQNGRSTLGWAFLATESALLAGAAITVPIYLVELQNRSDAYRAGDDVEADEYINRAYAVFYTNLAFVGAFAATSVIGVLEAELNYVPSVVEVKHREIPPPSQAVPLLTPSADGHGAMVGVFGRF
jgi:predicted negative regulator of RcsB-dependent stress response